MTLFQVIFLGLLQGLTEFLPVSSSGHLALAQHWLAIENPLTFDITLHLGTLVAVFIFFRNTLLTLLRDTLKAVKDRDLHKVPSVVWFTSIGAVPVTVIGICVKGSIETIFFNLSVVGVGFLVTSGLLFLADFLIKKNKPPKKMSWEDSLVIGLFQAVAVLPGISRSGSTVSAGIFRSLNREDAFTFSFLLAIPAILGALVLDLADMEFTSTHAPQEYVVGFLTAFASGYVALSLFKRIVVRKNLSWFSFYCLVLGILTIFIFA